LTDFAALEVSVV